MFCSRVLPPSVKKDRTHEDIVSYQCGPARKFAVVSVRRKDRPSKDPTALLRGTRDAEAYCASGIYDTTYC
jgi:hypothetical protein